MAMEPAVGVMILGSGIAALGWLVRHLFGGLETKVDQALKMLIDHHGRLRVLEDRDERGSRRPVIKGGGD